MLVRDLLAQSGGGVEQDLQPTEEALAEVRVVAQRRQQHLVAARHVEARGRRDLAQVGRGRRRTQRASACPRRCRACRRCRATRPKLWLPPKVWFHGSQSQSTGGSSARNAITVRSCSWLAAEHALGVDHALRRAGRSRGEEDLGDGVGSDTGVRVIDCRRRRRRSNAAKLRRRRTPGAGLMVTISTSSGSDRLASARAKRSPSAAKIEIRGASPRRRRQESGGRCDASE